MKSYDGNFDAYYREYTLQQQALQAQAEQQKKAAYEQNKQQSHKSKQQRALDAKRREQIRQLEKKIELTEELISKLEKEISDPAVASDYSAINEKCSQLDEARQTLEQDMELWAELADKV